MKGRFSAPLCTACGEDRPGQLEARTRFRPEIRIFCNTCGRMSMAELEEMSPQDRYLLRQMITRDR